MSFLDNLENNLKNMESAEEGKESAACGSTVRANRSVRAAKRSLRGPRSWKKSPFTGELLKQAARVGFSLRVKVHIAWLGTALRLEARGRRLELRPTPSGIVAAYLEGQRETRTEPVDLAAGIPESLVRGWLSEGGV